MLLHTLAHLGGRSFSAVVGFVIATLVATQLGAAAMGVYGIYMVLQGLMGILDGGMSTSINRAVALGSAGEAERANAMSLLRTYEWINGGLGCILLVSVGALLPWILNVWGAQDLVHVPARQMAVFVGAALAFRFMQTLYQHALFGAQQHIKANLVVGAFSVLRVVPIVVSLLFLGADLSVLFGLLALSNSAELIALVIVCHRAGLWRWSTKPSLKLLRDMASFMAPISGYTLIALLLSQADRIIIGHFVSIEQFGLYALIASYAAGLTSLAYAPGNVFYPTITQSLNDNDERMATLAIKRTLGMILFLVYPAALWAVFYGPEISALLFKDSATADATSSLWAPLFLSGCLSVMTIIPFKIFLAINRADLIFKINLFMLLAYPLGLSLGIRFLGFEQGLIVLPMLALIILYPYYSGVWKGTAQGKLYVKEIIVKSGVSMGLLSAFFVGSTFLRIEGTGLLISFFNLGWPLALAGLVSGFLLVVFPRLKPQGRPL